MNDFKKAEANISIYLYLKLLSAATYYWYNASVASTIFKMGNGDQHDIL